MSKATIRARQAAETRKRRTRLTIAAAGTAALAAAIAVIAVVAGGRETGSAGPGGGSPAAGSLAPAGSFTTVDGASVTISSLRGHPALVWLVTTWCPGCQAGTAPMPADLARLRARGIRVVELEDYADLGQPGPGMADFGRQLAGAAYHSKDWVFGTASQALTQAWNPRGYLDIYYLLDASGRIVYSGSAPTDTITQLLAHATRLT